MKKPVNSSTVSGTLRSRGSMPHWPSNTRIRLPGGERARVRHPQPDHRPLAAAQWIDDSEAGFGLVGKRVPDRDPVAGRAGQVLEDLDREHPALTVADQHRHHALALVMPRELPCKFPAVGEARIREAPVARVAQALGRIAHGDEKLGEGLHRHERHAAVEIDDARRRCKDERFKHLTVRNVLGIERQHALLDRRIHGDGTQHRPRRHRLGDVLCRACRGGRPTGPGERHREHGMHCQCRSLRRAHHPSRLAPAARPDNRGKKRPVCAQ